MNPKSAKTLQQYHKLKMKQGHKKGKETLPLKKINTTEQEKELLQLILVHQISIA